MANTDHMAKLRKGARVWNQWRQDNPNIAPDLKQAHLHKAMLSRFDLRDAVITNANLDGAFLRFSILIGAQLGGTSLKESDCHGADCRGASMQGARFDFANMRLANLRSAKLVSTGFSKACMEKCNLERADLRAAMLSGAFLGKANLTEANLVNARLDNADLSFANFTQANLRHTNLRGANAHGADFRLAILHLCILDGADLTDSRLWESQRAQWSIKGIVCERAFWDKDGSVASEFAPGDFERLYGNQFVIELFYEGGITAFEVNTLPALLHVLSKLHPLCQLRLASISETNSGALITIRAEGTAAHELLALRDEAEKLRDLQTNLRASERLIDRLQIEKDLLLDEVFPRLAARSVNTVNITAPTTHMAIGFDHSSPQAMHSEGLDTKAILELLGDIKSQTASLNPRQPLAIEVAQAIEIAQGTLIQRESKPSILSEALNSVKEVATRALTSEAATMLGDRLPALIQQLEHFLKSRS